jgi:hypothetical protein
MNLLVFLADLADEINANPNHSPESERYGTADYLVVAIALVVLIG